MPRRGERTCPAYPPPGCPEWHRSGVQPSQRRPPLNTFPFPEESHRDLLERRRRRSWSRNREARRARRSFTLFGGLPDRSCLCGMEEVTSPRQCSAHPPRLPPPRSPQTGMRRALRPAIPAKTGGLGSLERHAKLLRSATNARSAQSAGIMSTVPGRDSVDGATRPKGKGRITQSDISKRRFRRSAAVPRRPPPLTRGRRTPELANQIHRRRTPWEHYLEMRIAAFVVPPIEPGIG
jgi:hypothetical protein